MWVVRTVLAVLFVALAAGIGSQSRAAEDVDRLQSLIQEMKSQLDRGENERLIDPWFLRDLRDLLAGYDRPWRRLILSDDFSGDGPQPGPPWQVTAGEFLIDWRLGLRSVVTAAPAAPAEPKKSDKDDALKQLFGQVLKEALKVEEPEEAAPASGSSFAAVMAPVAISNAFALSLEMTSRPIAGASGGRFEFGPYQGAGAASGYRLVYIPGTGLEFLGLSSRGTRTLEVYDQALNLQDGEPHKLEWSRSAAGQMKISLDGVVVMDFVDRAFQDPFDGLAVVNSGGDFALRRIDIHGS